LENNFRLIQDEGIDWEDNPEEWATIETEARVLDSTLISKREELNGINKQLNNLNDTLKGKDVEITKLHRDKIRMERNNTQLAKDKVRLENDLANIKKEQRDIQKKLSKFIEVKEEVDKEDSAGKAFLDDLKKEKQQLLKDLKKLEANKHSIKLNTQEDNLIKANKKLEVENTKCYERIKELKQELTRVQDLYEGKLNLLNSQLPQQASGRHDKYKECKNINETEQCKTTKAYTERKVSNKEESSKTRDKPLNRIDRNIMSDNKVLSAKKELERIKNAHSKLLENRKRINEELTVLKEHTELLRTHNLKTHDELDARINPKYSRNEIEKSSHNVKHWNTQF